MASQPQPPAGEVAFIRDAPFCLDRRRASQLAPGAAVPYERLEAPPSERPWGDEEGAFRYHVPAQPPAQRVAAFYSAFPGLAASLAAGAPPSPELASALGMASPAAPPPWRFARLRHGPHPPLPGDASDAAASSDAAPAWAENGPLAWTLAHYFLNAEDEETAAEEGGPALPPAPSQQQQQQGHSEAGEGGGAAPASSAAQAAVEEHIALPAIAPPRLPCLHLGPLF